MLSKESVQRWSEIDFERVVLNLSEGITVFEELKEEARCILDHTDGQDAENVPEGLDMEWR